MAGIHVLLRIIITIYCVRKARKLNLNAFSWGFVAFIFPIISVIAIQFMKKRIIPEYQMSSTSFKSTKPINYTLYMCLCYVAMFFALGANNPVINTDISWIFMLGYGTLWVVLLLAISKYSKLFLGYEKIPFTFLIVMAIIGSIFSVLMEFMDEYEMEKFFIAILIAIILYVIAMMVTGIKIRKLKGNSWFSSLGTAFIVNAVASIIAAVLIFLFEDEIFDLILSFIVQIYLLQVTWLLFKEAKKSNIKTTEVTSCPYCGEKIMAMAAKCEHCGEWIEIQNKDINKQENNEQSDKSHLAQV